MIKGKLVTIADNEEFLRQISSPVIFPDKELEGDVKILEDYFNIDNRFLAMAAIQLGIPKRIIYLINTDLELIKKINNNEASLEEKNHNEKRVLINSEILSREGLTEYWEACGSCLDNIGLVKRPYKIRIKYQDINGIYHEEDFEGFESTVLSHEMDHMDGILHIDIAEECFLMNDEERKEFRKTHGYVIISKDGNYDELVKEKRD